MAMSSYYYDFGTSTLAYKNMYVQSSEDVMSNREMMDEQQD